MRVRDNMTEESGKKKTLIFDMEETEYWKPICGLSPSVDQTDTSPFPAYGQLIR